MLRKQLPPESVRRKAAAALLVTCIFWGLSFPLNKAIAEIHAQLAPDEDDWFVTASTIWPRFVIAAVILGSCAWRRLAGLTWLEAWQGIGLAMFMSGGVLLQVDGLRHTEASTSAFLSQCYVILLPVVIYGRQWRWPPKRILFSTALVVAGVAVLADVDWRMMRMGRGEFETLVSTVFFTGQILWLDRAKFSGNRVMPVTFVMFTVIGLLFLGTAGVLASRPVAVVQPLGSLPWVIFSVILAIVCTVIALTVMNAWQPRLRATEAGLIYATEPVWASLMVLFVPGWISAFAQLDYPNETVTLNLLVGGGLITMANVIIQLAPPRAHPEVVRGEVL